ncbi:hypothetical protein ACVMIH_002340 [Bradyrhizobium sp. USDA 4503]
MVLSTSSSRSTNFSMPFQGGEVRYELVDGIAYAMAGAKEGHNASEAMFRRLSSSSKAWRAQRIPPVKGGAFASSK